MEWLAGELTRRFSRPKRGEICAPKGESCAFKRLRLAEDWYDIVLARTQQVLDEYDSMSPPDGSLALKKALKFRDDKMDDYAEALIALMQLMIRNQLSEVSVSNADGIECMARGLCLTPPPWGTPLRSTMSRFDRAA